MCHSTEQRKFIAFTVNQLEFKDSFRFLLSSLEKLVKLTKYGNGEKRENGQNNFYHGKKSVYITNDEDLDLLTDKGVYPYDYFVEEISLVTRSYQVKKQEGIKHSEYERAKKIWEHFNIQYLGMYHDLYLGTHVLLLTDVFENFRKTCLEDYQLDPAGFCNFDFTTRRSESYL